MKFQKYTAKIYREKNGDKRRKGRRKKKRERNNKEIRWKASQLTYQDSRMKNSSID